MRSIRYLNVILTVLAVLLAGQLWTAWVATPGTPVLAASAQAAPPSGGIPDSGAQLQQIIDLLKRQTQQTEDLMTLLRSGQVRVQVDAPKNADKRG